MELSSHQATAVADLERRVRAARADRDAAAAGRAGALEDLRAQKAELEGA